MEYSKKKMNKTWFIDIDGVIFPHNAYLNLDQTEIETPLPGVTDFFRYLDPADQVVLVTARSKKYELFTENSLKINNIRYNLIISFILRINFAIEQKWPYHLSGDCIDNMNLQYLLYSQYPLVCVTFRSLLKSF